MLRVESISDGLIGHEDVVPNASTLKPNQFRMIVSIARCQLVTY